MGGGFNAGRFSNDILGKAGAEGIFDPTGSPRIRAMARRRAMMNADSQRRRAKSLAGLAGLDSYGQRQSIVDADMGATQGLVDNLGEVDYNELSGNRDRLWGLLGSERQMQEQRAAEERERKSRGGFGGWLGQTLGSVAGSFIPGLGGGGLPRNSLRQAANYGGPTYGRR